MKIFKRINILFVFVLFFTSLYANEKTKTVTLDYDDIKIYDLKKHSFMKVFKNNKQGYINKDGKVVIDVIYDNIEYFNKSGLSVATKDKKMGMIDTKGNIIIPFIYDKIYNSLDKTYKVLLNGKYGLIDEKNNIKIPIQYDEITIKDDALILYKEHKFILANKKGEILSDSFDEIMNLSENFAVVRIDGRWHFFDKKTKKIYDEAYDNIDTIYNHSFVKIRKKGEFALFSTNDAKIVVPFGYEFKRFLDKDLIVVKKDEKFGLFDIKGNMISDCIYDDLEYYRNNKMINVKKDNLWGYINKKGKVIIPIVSKNEHNHGIENHYLQKGKDNLWHIFDKEGKEIGKGFQNIYFLKDDKLAVQKDNKNYLVDIKNPDKILAKFKDYDNIEKYNCDCNTDILIVRKDGKYGLINMSGEEIVKPIYDYLSSWTTASIKFKKDGKYGIMDFKGNIVLEPTYDKLEWAHGCNAVALGYVGKRGYDRKWQLVDLYAKPISKFYSASIVLGYEKLPITDMKTRLSGVLDPNGKEILPLKYKSTQLLRKNLILVRDNEKRYAFFDDKGKQITPFSKYSYDFDIEDNMLLVKEFEKKGYTQKLVDWKIYDIKTHNILFEKEIK